MARIDEILTQEKHTQDILDELYEHEKTVSKWLDANQHSCKYTKEELYIKYKRILEAIVELERELKCN